MKHWVFWLLTASLVFIQTTITTVPLVLLLLLLFYITKRDLVVFLAAFLAGLLLDILALRTLGESSLFLIVFLFLVDLYEKKFEIQTMPFVFFASFLGSLVYLWIFDYRFILEQSLASAILAVVLFAIIQKFFQKKITPFL